MENILYLISWDKDKTKTWSGTGWSMYNALKKYFVVEDINIAASNSFLNRIKDKIFCYFGARDMSLSLIRKKRGRITPLLAKKNNNIVFQFEEIIKDSNNVKTYIYQDLSVNFLNYLKENRPNEFAVSGFQSIPERAFNKRLANQDDYYSTCSGILCMGEWLKRDFVERIGIPADKVFAIGGGSNLKVENIKDLKKGNNKILFVGRDFNRKGGKIVYEAFVLLLDKLPGAELYVAGPKTDPITDPVVGYHYLGDLNPDQLSVYFNKCDIFCMPSYFEAYGLVFVEALTYGLPCIGRNRYEMPYLIEDGETGLLINEDNVEELSDKMFQLLSDNRIKNNVLAKRQWYINNYSWDVVAQRAKQAIEENQ